MSLETDFKAAAGARPGPATSRWCRTNGIRRRPAKICCSPSAAVVAVELPGFLAKGVSVTLGVCRRCR